MRVNLDTGEYQSPNTCFLTSSGFYQGQLVQVYGLDSVMPSPAVIPGTIGRGAAASNLPQSVGTAVTGAATSASSVTQASKIPTWIWVVVLGILAYILVWKVYYREG